MFISVSHRLYDTYDDTLTISGAVTITMKRRYAGGSLLHVESGKASEALGAAWRALQSSSLDRKLSWEHSRSITHQITSELDP